ncbi:MAG: lysophospholipid transporter LplT [Methylococcales symbiont of Hymedesmia sp. n. MRB-2018]|nr:MAG: lysophospholipid transporter LplT [Methylococcales symbiont of Hymedesmia sp. n. MRB-2018]
MNKRIYPLLIAQFLSAFADNAILFTVIALVMQSVQLATWYVPALQSVFLISFVILAPWVGSLADNYAKSQVLIIANLVKASGAGLLLLNFEPLIAYCVVGMGAAIYSPAKYGILPELTNHDALVKANSWIEGSTILAILLGMVIGAKVADYSIQWALIGTIVLFASSAFLTLLIPTQASREKQAGSKLILFSKQIGQFFITSRSRFAILGASLFWVTAVTVRVIIIAWAPVVLMSQNASEVAELTLFLAIGIIIGSALVPRMIPLDFLARARIPAYFMGLFIMLLSFTETLWPARATLFAIGTAGGMFIVPINAALQELGQESIGSGCAVALQGFFQNVAMLIAVATYTFTASILVDDVISVEKLDTLAANLVTRTFTSNTLLFLGAFVLLATFLVSLRLPDNNTST